MDLWPSPIFIYVQKKTIINSYFGDFGDFWWFCDFGDFWGFWWSGDGQVMVGWWKELVSDQIASGRMGVVKNVTKQSRAEE